MLTRYPQLQSGFIARTERSLSKPKPLDPNTIRSMKNAPATNTQENFFYSVEVDKYVDAFIQDPTIFNNLDKQQELFQLVAILFDKQGIWSFIKLQENNPGLSLQHVNFLEETTRVVCGGIQRRSIPVASWSSLLSTANQPLRAPFKLGQSNFSHMRDYEPVRDLTETIVCWLRNGGWSDFMLSLQTLFGSRTVHAIRGRTR